MIIKSHEIPRIIKGHWATRNLAGFWGMMPYEVGGSIAHDLSGNDRNGTIYGNVSWKPGPNGTTLDFPGSSGDYISIDTQAGNTGTSDFSLIGAFKIPALPSAYEGILSRYNGGVAPFWYLAIADTNKLVLGIKLSDTTQYCYSDAVLVAEIWYKFVVTFRRSGLVTLYINNIAQADSEDISSDSAVSIPASEVVCGGLDGTTWNSVIQVNYLSIILHCLTTSEIDLIYRESFCMLERDPIELWSAATQGGAPPAGHPYYYREIANRRIA